jgi:hypothetical protein
MTKSSKIASKLALALIVPLMLSAPAMAQSVTMTTGNGGTVVKSRDCIRGNGVAQCEGTTTATTAAGQTVSKNRVRTTDAYGSTSTITNSGPGGESNSRTRRVTW